jgi:hypothetical protein
MIMNEENKTDSKLIFKTEKDFNMYFQTTLRNILLSTTVSFAALGYSRYYRNKSKLYSIGMILVSSLIIMLSANLNLMLHKTILQHNKYNIKNLTQFNKLILIVHILLLFFSFYTLYRISTNQYF